MEELVEEWACQRAVPRGQQSAEERSALGMESLMIAGLSKQCDVWETIGIPEGKPKIRRDL